MSLISGMSEEAIYIKLNINSDKRELPKGSICLAKMDYLHFKVKMLLGNKYTCENLGNWKIFGRRKTQKIY